MNARVRVVKIGGRPQSDPLLPGAIAHAWAQRANALVLVHGGGDEISALQRASGVEPRFVGGRRVTSEQDIAILRMALSGSANKRLVSALNSALVNAVGISGEDAGLFSARAMDLTNMGRVGEPFRVRTELVRVLLDAGFLPVISPLSRDAAADATTGGGERSALNVNGDDAAAMLAVALGAEELLLVADVAGVLANGQPVPRLDPEGARALIDDGTAAGGMAAKLEAALMALDGEVERVRIGDIAAIADPHRGTVIAREASPV
ncbi:MAG TPA: acetylglutamate kinase [Gemmatimonadaceae bacterium]